MLPGPRRAWIVTTSQCNLRCLHCLRSLPEFRAVSQGTEDMPESTFDKFESQVLPTLESVQFGGTNLGEPMMSSSFEEHLRRIARGKAIREIKIQTNGTLLNERRLELLVALNVRLMVSLEGATPESYEDVRGHAFDRLVTALRQYREAREAHPDSCADLYLSFTVRHETLGELDRLVDLAAEMAVGRVVVTHYVPIREEDRFQCLYYHRGEANAAFERAAQRAQALGICFNAPACFLVPDIGVVPGNNGLPHDGEPPCLHPWTSVSINERGDVMPCCGSTAVMGNLGQEDFAAIWNGRRFTQLRATVNTPRPPRYCCGCFLRGVDLDHPPARLPTSERFLLSRIGFGEDITARAFLCALGQNAKRSLCRTLLISRFGRLVVPALRSLRNRMK